MWNLHNCRSLVQLLGIYGKLYFHVINIFALKTNLKKFRNSISNQKNVNIKIFFNSPIALPSSTPGVFKVNDWLRLFSIFLFLIFIKTEQKGNWRQNEFLQNKSTQYLLLITVFHPYLIFVWLCTHFQFYFSLMRKYNIQQLFLCL